MKEKLEREEEAQEDSFARNNLWQCCNDRLRYARGIKMKRRVVAIMAIVMMFCLTACDDGITRINNNQQTSEEKEENTNRQEQEALGVGNNSQKEEDTTEEAFVEIPKAITNDAVLTGVSQDILENMTLEQKIGQLFIVNLEALDTTNGSYYEYRTITDPMIERLQKYNIGGVTLFSRNIETREQTKELNRKLQENSYIPLFISVDEEGGDVARIANNENMKTTQFPSMETVGATQDLEYANEVGTTIGEEIRQLGFNLDFAPVADVKTEDLNTEIGNRSFGSDQDLVSSMVTEVLKGLQKQGISATLKHFPGQGSTMGNSHEGAVNLDVDAEHFREVELKPFASGINAGADFVMVSHISISRITGDLTPASLCSVVCKDMLRNEMGFQGVIITDAMDMKAITDSYTSKQATVGALQAGVDVVLMPANFEEAYNGVLEAVQTGELTEEQINEKVIRILKTKIKRGIISESAQVVLDAQAKYQ